MKRNLRNALSLYIVIALLSSFSLLHDFFISITSIDFNNESNTLEISCQFIAHDVEEAIISIHNIDLHLGEPNEHPKSDSILFAYVLSNFELNTNSLIPQSKITYSYVGKEVNLDETLWVYLESLEIEKPTTLNIKNSFLLDNFESQSNITHVNFGKKQQTFSFNNLSKSRTYTLK